MFEIYGKCNFHTPASEEIQDIIAFQSHLKEVKRLRYRSLTICSTETNAFTPETNEKIAEIILDYLTKDFSLVKLRMIGIGFNEEVNRKINTLLERNRRIKHLDTKNRIIFWSYMAGVVMGGGTWTALGLITAPAMIALALGAAFFYVNMKYPSNPILKKITKSLPDKIATGNMILLVFSPVFYCSLLPFIFALTAALFGIIFREFHSEILREAFEKYADIDTDKEINISEEEKNSFEIGLKAQKTFMPSYYLGLTTWRYPGASYVGAYCPEDVLPPAFKRERPSL